MFLKEFIIVDFRARRYLNELYVMFILPVYVVIFLLINQVSNAYAVQLTASLAMPKGIGTGILAGVIVWGNTAPTEE